MTKNRIDLKRGDNCSAASDMQLNPLSQDGRRGDDPICTWRKTVERKCGRLRGVGKAEVYFGVTASDGVSV